MKHLEFCIIFIRTSNLIECFIMDKGGTAGKFTEQELLSGIHHADRVVFTYLYSQNFRSLLATAMRYVKEVEAGEEIVQDVFLKLWETPGDILSGKVAKTLFTSPGY